jgi:enoyl-CoA hydratase
MSQMDGQSEATVLVSRVGSIGRIRLNRPKALNSLTLDMVRVIDEALDEFESDPAIAAVLLTGEGERGLCAGGDIRAIYESGLNQTNLAETFWREEYVLNARIARYSKPYIAVLDGITMGGGVGISAHGSHRIVTEKTKLAMPETGIGYLPDVGATWLLSHAPGELGTYLGLTGELIGAADTMAAGLADHYVETTQLDALYEALSQMALSASASEITAAITRFSSTPPAARLSIYHDVIDRTFSADCIEDVASALEADGSDFALNTWKLLLTKSPTSLVVTLRLLRLARVAASLEECLERELAGSLQMLAGRELFEGIRAAVIDKDRKPKWDPPTIEAVGPIDHYLDLGSKPKLFALEG